MSTKTRNGTGVKPRGRPQTKLDCIADQAAEDLKAFIAESKVKLAEAWAAVEAEASDQETKPVLRIGFAIALDLQADKMETTLTFGVRHKLSTEREMPDPNQAEMDLDPEAA